MLAQRPPNIAERLPSLPAAPEFSLLFMRQAWATGSCHRGSFQNISNQRCCADRLNRPWPSLCYRSAAPSPCGACSRRSGCEVPNEKRRLKRTALILPSAAGGSRRREPVDPSAFGILFRSHDQPQLLAQGPGHRTPRGVCQPMGYVRVLALSAARRRSRVKLGP